MIGNVSSPQAVKKSVPRLVLLALLGVAAVVAALQVGPVVFAGSFFRSLAVVFQSIFLEALPFLLFGSVVAAIVHLYLPPTLLRRLLPGRPGPAILAASVAGLALPVCECAIVPVVRRLIGKGLPVSVAVTFLFAVPIINPLVIASTWVAFADRPTVVLLRIAFGLAGPLLAGTLVQLLFRREEMGRLVRGVDASTGHEHHAIPYRAGKRHLIAQVVHVAHHAALEFVEMGQYFLLGVLISSFVQALPNRDALLTLGDSSVGSVLTLSAGAYLLSLCSEADAFIARTFLGQVSGGSLIAFLVLGPMMDLKNTLMLRRVFRWEFVLLLIVLAGAVAVFAGLLVNNLGVVE